MTIHKEILYPFFFECCQFAPDSFWKNVFEDLAYGKTPYGTYISKDYFCCNYKNKKFSYKIQRKEPKLLYTDIYRLLNNKFGLLSSGEKIKKMVHFRKTETEIKKSRQYWKDIRKKNIKDILIENYVVNMKKKHSLTRTKTKYLLSMITLAVIFKVITAKDINYNGGKIINIAGIEFKKEGRETNVFITKPLYATIGYPEDAESIETLSDTWNKYITTLRKTYQK